MPTFSRLTRLFETAEEIPFDDTSRIILMSDNHRGDNSWADDFAGNQNLYIAALEHYYRQGFTYVELGDGDDLWKCRRLSDITEVYGHIFQLLDRFHRENRLYMLWGNHDMVKKFPGYFKKTLIPSRGYLQETTRSAWFEGLQVHEGLVLRLKGTEHRILLLHGHQGDYLNYDLWYLARFLVRHVWRTLELIGVNNTTSAARNYKKRTQTEDYIVRWINEHHQPVMAGHTHRPALPAPGQAPYFNTGSCVHPRGITGIEICQGKVTLVQWRVKAKPDGTLYAGKEVLAGPERISRYFE